MSRPQTARGVSHLTLVSRAKPKPCPDVVESLTLLLALAKEGEIVGLAFAVDQRGGAYITDVAGTYFERPTVARGAVAFLSDQLATLVHKMDPDKPR